MKITDTQDKTADLIKPHAGKWVTISSDRKRIVGSSKRMETALNHSLIQIKSSLIRLMTRSVSALPLGFDQVVNICLMPASEQLSLKRLLVG